MVAVLRSLSESSTVAPPAIGSCLRGDARRDPPGRRPRRALGSRQSTPRRYQPIRGSAAAATACTVGTAATTNSDPGQQKTQINWSSEALSFSALGFTIADPVYYQYRIEGTSSCGNIAGRDLYSFQAIGDLDGDNSNSLFEIQAGSTNDNELMRSPGIYRQNELE